MKRIACILSALCLLGAVSCIKEEASLTVSKNSVTITSKAGSIDLGTVTSNYEWTAEVSQETDWLALTTPSGKEGTSTISATYAENKSQSPRAALVTLTCRDKTASITVIQAAGESQAEVEVADTLQIAEKEGDIGAEGGAFAVTVESNIHFQVSVNDPWISEGSIDSSAVAGSTLTKYVRFFTADRNTSYSERSGSIIFTNSDYTIQRTFTITQAAAIKPVVLDTLTISPSSASIGYRGGNIAVTVDANAAYGVKIGGDWISRNGEADSSAITGTTRKQYFHSFTIAENTGYSDRTATIAFTSADDSITRTFTVKQDAAPEPVVVLDTLTVSPSQASFPYSGGSTTVTVDANVSYSVSSDAEWIAMTGGTDSTAIGGTTRKKYIHTFTAAANDGYSRRSATITFCNADNSIVRTFNVIQEALPFRDTLTISPDNAEFTKEGGTATITVESNVPYLVTAGADWISSGGDPDSTAIAGTTRKKYAHTFAIAANSAYSSRSAKIAFSSRDNSITRTFTVTQDALTLRDTLAISPSSADLGLEGGSTAVTVDANVRYSVAISEPWITSNGEVDSSSIDGTTRKHYFHSFTAASNTTYSSRSATITFTSDDNSVSRVFTVHQASRTFRDTLEISPAYASIASEGGSTAVTVESNVRYLTHKDASWISSEAVVDSSSIAGTTRKKYFHTFAVEANDSYSVRTAAVTITSEDHSIDRDFIVIQSGLTMIDTLDISPAADTVTYAAGSAAVTVDANVGYTSTISGSWISPKGNVDSSAISGTTRKQHFHSYSVAANTMRSDRTGTITYVSSDKSISRTFTLVQTAAPAADTLTLSTYTATASSIGGTVAVDLQTNITGISTAISSNASSWVTQSASVAKAPSGSSSLYTYTISFTVGQNSTTSSRTATVTFTGNKITRVFTITQEAGETVVVTVPDENDVVYDPSDDDYVGNTSFGGIIHVKYSASSASVSGSVSGVSASLSGADVTVTSTASTPVIYYLTGTTSAGSFKIYSNAKFEVMLGGLTMTSTSGPAINSQSKKRCFIVSLSNTTNTLSDASAYTTTGTEDAKGCIFSEGQIVFSGGGKLTVKGNAKHAICSDQYVRIMKNSNIIVPTSVTDGIHANASFRQDGGTLNITTSSDGIDVDEGGITINDGTITIASSGTASKAIKCPHSLDVNGGTLVLSTSGAGEWDSTEKDVSASSCIKAGGNITWDSAKATMTSTGQGGKGMSADSTITINSGTINISTTGKKYSYRTINSNPKGIKADIDVIINGGSTSVTASGGEGSEGIESKRYITINGGTVAVTSYDDAINAARTNSITGSGKLTVNGGNIYAYSTNNDALDANGTFLFTGGVTVAVGSSAPECGFDCDQSNFAITGGTLIGFGGDSSVPTSGSCTQRSVVYYSAPTGALLALLDQAGASLFTFNLTRTYNGATMLYSSPSLASNSTFTLYSGGSVTGGTTLFNTFTTGGTYTAGTVKGSFTTSSMVTTVGTGGGPGGGGPGGRP